MRCAIETKIGHFTLAPSNVDLRRNNVVEIESTGNAVVTLWSPSKKRQTILVPPWVGAHHCAPSV
jgi:hypothetical protein